MRLKKYEFKCVNSTNDTAIKLIQKGNEKGIIFSDNQKKGKGGEIHITDSIRRLILEGNEFIGHEFKGKYLDCGTMSGYLKSSNEMSKL